MGPASDSRGRFHDQCGDGGWVVCYRYMPAAKQGLELGAGRKLVEVTGLVPQQQQVA
jgi:hypothetical protein